MEKEKLFMNYTGLQPNWRSSVDVEGQLVEMNCSSNQFLNINWENSMDQSTPFESAMSSFVSSPGSALNSAGPADSAAIGELIGRLGGLCHKNRELSPSQMAAATGGGGGGASFAGGSTNSIDTPCYSTPLNSPPKRDLLMLDHQIRSNVAPFAADPEFAERAAKFSCFSGSNIGGMVGQFSSLGVESGNLLEVSSNQSLKIGPQIDGFQNKDKAIQDRLDAELRPNSASGSAPDRKSSKFLICSSPDEESSNAGVEASASAGETSLKDTNEVNGRKRKAKGKELLQSSASFKDAKNCILQVDLDGDNSNEKRCKSAEAFEKGKDVVEVKKEQSSNSNGGSGSRNQNKDLKLPEPPKQDYIHVRARRGQATDSHSLAERVRREKINERMKLLQDLVPGCNKVTGKAVMLDEIINYVQSLQRQVEFLSMKLAHVNPRLDFNMEALLSKDILQMRGSLPQTVYPLDSLAAPVYSYGHQPQQGPPQTAISNGLETGSPSDATLRRSLGAQLPASEGNGNFSSQLAALWENDLHSVFSTSHRTETSENQYLI
eukprot:TRINITY_DN8280_c0_g1_i1.p1 TRINITY_DN8280_c0_g1~~TRINITY_DN8280_c0_g1_i1.p1  ORF type:complete len:548 (-),score=122.48 TRINITY_DN8280_c0_g1_i1:422-2065(-)